MCSARVDPIFILEAFSCGADGVFVGGCHLGECHYQFGNYDAIITAAFVRRVLTKSGVRADRLALEWASAAEGSKYVQMITNFTNKISELGPLGVSERLDTDELKLKLSAAGDTLRGIKLRTRLGNLTRTFRDEGDYSERTVKDRLGEKVADAIDTEIGRRETFLWIQKEPSISLGDLTKKVGVSISEIEKYISFFDKKGLVTETDGRVTVSS